MRRDMGSKSKVFEPRVPDGHQCNITPNGSAYDKGDQGMFSNSYYPKGKLDTVSVGETTRDTKDIPRPNRSGEGNGDCY